MTELGERIVGFVEENGKTAAEISSGLAAIGNGSEQAGLDAVLNFVPPEKIIQYSLSGATIMAGLGGVIWISKKLYKHYKENKKIAVKIKNNINSEGKDNEQKN